MPPDRRSTWGAKQGAQKAEKIQTLMDSGNFESDFAQKGKAGAGKIRER